MNKQRYRELLRKLDSILKADGSIPSVSPAPTGPGVSASGLYIFSHMDIESLSKNDLLLAHALLHKFYITGNKILKKDEIVDLHKKVAERMSHSRFDTLDDY